MELNKILKPLILKTKISQTSCASNVEVHTLLCSKDLCQYILAIKSFLMFYDDVQVVAHDDGTLTSNDKRLLAQHVRGMRLIGRREADRIVKKRLAGNKCCLAYRSKCSIFFQVMDYFTFSETKKLISLDSDTLFFQYPSEVINWIGSRRRVVRYNNELRAGTFPIDVLDPDFPFPLINGFNGGFACVYNDIADYDLLEKSLKYIAESREGAGYAPWLPLLSQDLMGCCVASSGIRHQALPPEKYKTLVNYARSKRIHEFRKKCIFRHYNWPELRWRKDFGYEEDMRVVLDTLL